MQVQVQKSTRTTRPRRPSGVSGSELSHLVAPSNDGRRPSTGSSRRSPARRWTIERIRPGVPGGTDAAAAPDARSVDPVSSDIGLSFGVVAGYRLAQWLESRAHLLREELRLFPGGEVAAL